MPTNYIDKILRARVYDVALESPLQRAANLSRRLNNAVWLKREDLQPVFSFKLRGAYNKMANLTAEQRAKPVITASAGNHAQGVAMAAERVGLVARIVMPTTTPQIKIDAVRNYGATVILHGDTYDEAHEHACELARKDTLTFIHPYDDPDVIAGQGTIAMEILRQHPDPLEAIFVPVGGGGLLAGVAAYTRYVRPEIKIIGVEPHDAGSMYHALAANKRVILPRVGIFADGVAVRQVGAETFRIAKETVDEVILVSTDEICWAIKDIFEDTRGIAEPAGALAIAGLKRYVERDGISGRSLVAIESGANMNFDRLRHVAERSHDRETLLGVVIPERPGSFRHFCDTVGWRHITEFSYRLTHPSRAHVLAGIELTGGEVEKRDLTERLTTEGYAVSDLSQCELTKQHIRYMIGGHSAHATDELLYSVGFPERRGALVSFLREMGDRWNISLFHYRNVGTDYGRVLLGVQVPSNEVREFEAIFERLGFPYQSEAENVAYALFLNQIAD